MFWERIDRVQDIITLVAIPVATWLLIDIRRKINKMNLAGDTEK
jgi:hypothetical protein